MEEGFGIDVDLAGGVVRLWGDLDAHTAPLLDQAVDELVAAGASTVVLDLAGVSFVDSSGLRSMILAGGEGGRRTVVLRSPAPSTRRLLDITDLTERFRIEP